MNIKDMLRLLITNEQFTRQAGKTTALKEACKKIDGVFVCHSQDLAKEHKGVIFSRKQLLGNVKPLILDNHIQYLIHVEALNRIDYLEAKIKKIKEVICTE